MLIRERIITVRSLGFGHSLVGFAFLLSTFYFLDSHLVLAADPPPPPIISVAPQTYYPFDEVLYLEGRALPKSRVELFFEKPGSPPVRLVVDANANGEWFWAQKLELVSGEWTVRSRILGDPPSDWSNPRIITSRVTGFVFGSIKVRYLPIIATISILLLGAVLLLGYALVRVRTVRELSRQAELKQKTEVLERSLREKERHEVEALVEENFAELRREIAEELEHFEARARSGKLSRVEAEHREELMRRLRRVEAEIERKLREIA